jgi:hypothetical protein
MAPKGRVNLEGLVAAKGTPLPAATVQQRGSRPTPDLPTATTKIEERMVALTVKVPASLYMKLRLFAAGQNLTHQEVGLAALRAYLDKQAT